MINCRSNSPLRILVADDNEANCLVASTIFERAGHSVTIVKNGFIAVQMANFSVYDLIVLDIMMPVMDGLEAFHKIRKNCAHNQKTPIFALTAYCDPDDQRRYRAAGFDTVMSKPLRRGDLERALAKYKIRDNAPPKRPLDTESFTQVPLLDENKICLLSKNYAPEGALDIQSQFWASMQKTCRTIETSLPLALHGKNSSLSDFRQAVHEAKGTCDSIGLLRAAHIARDLRNLPPSEIRGLMGHFLDALSDSRPALMQALSGARKLDPPVQMRGEDQSETTHDSQNYRSAVGYKR